MDVLGRPISESRLIAWEHTFIDNVPGIASALVVLHDVGDMVLQDRSQCRIGPRSTGDCLMSAFAKAATSVRDHTPVGQLLVPDQVVASQNLIVGLGQVRNDIALGEAEGVLRRLGRVPLSQIYISLGMSTQTGKEPEPTFCEFPGVI